MGGHARHIRMRLGWFVIALVILVLAIDGGVSRTEALDRWTGTAVATAEGITFSFDFNVAINPGCCASWEWRFRGIQILSGSLAATVSGSTVNGTLFPADPSVGPCNFSGTIAGNRVDGIFDPGSCGGTGTFFLIKR